MTATMARIEKEARLDGKVEKRRDGTYLKQNDLVDKSCVAKKLSNDCVAIPVHSSFIDNYSAKNNFCGIPFRIDAMHLQKSRHMKNSPKDVMLNCVKAFCEEKEVWISELERDVPSAWEKHTDMLILPPNCFGHEVWSKLGSELWKKLAAATGCCRIARQKSISNNHFRSPNVELLLGSDGWVEHIDNKIRYSFDVTRCMFSSGNVTEKLRIASFNCLNETVVDLYAGIGYFTLPYLVHSGASLLYACEWNPDAVEALNRNLLLNGVQDRCVVLVGDNRQTCPRGVADRVNLGLIPSSEHSWIVACAALKYETGGTLHVHGNVTSYSYIHEPRHVSEASSDVHNSIVNGVVSAGGDQLVELANRDPDVGLSNSCSERSDDVAQSDSSSSITFSGNGDIKLKDASGFNPSVSKFAKKRRPRDEWRSWADSVCRVMEKNLIELHDRRWSACVLHVEHVKSYAPHVDHVVADIRCSPD